MGQDLQLMKQHIKEEFIKLVMNTDSNITVAQLVKNCDITRRTFYYHFDDIRDLSIWIFRTELAEYLKKRVPEQKLVYTENTDKYYKYPFYMNGRTIEDNLVLTPFWYALFDYFFDRKKYYKRIFTNRLQFDMNKYIFKLYSEEFKKDILFYLNGRDMLPEMQIFLQSFYLNAIWGWYINVCTEDLIVFKHKKGNYLPDANNLAIESLKYEIDLITSKN